ncbi:hypothetical protein KY285_017055 [Solanum tuberosum]|uniref:F-box protein interaction domain containing protein n=2 Tax=Solanum tuberosum TaxID=4113 RepID=M1CEP9_SOLTU|nr:hypothetical protein KY285_017055 [Solanum tuberosum]
MIRSKCNMEFQEDILGEIISRLPLKFVVQCKLLSKNFNRMISHLEFAQILFQRHKDTSTQLIYSNYDERLFSKFSLNPITRSVTISSYDSGILDICNGLILFEFELTMPPSRCCCVFNPITGAHQLIPFPKSPEFELETTGLTVDYPNSDQYKLVTISKVVENSSLFYKFHLLSSERSGLWREIQLRTNTFISFSDNLYVYWRNSLYWLRSDGIVLAFDTKKEEAILIDRPEFIDHYVLSYGKVLTSRDMSGSDIWLGRAKDLLTLVCIFRKYIVIGTYDRTSSCWRVSHTLDNFVLGPDGNIIGFPVWIDSKQVSFLVQSTSPGYRDLYEYDAKINGYKNAAVLDKVDYPVFPSNVSLCP